MESTVSSTVRKLRSGAIGLAFLVLFSTKSEGQLGTPPLITVQPLDLSVLNGGKATFSAVAVSLTSMSFTWLCRGQPVSPAYSSVANVVVPLVGTVSTLTMTNIVPALGGPYSVRVVNGVGSATSSPAVLSVNGGIAVDHVSSTNTTSTGGTRLTWPHTTAAGANSFLLVNVSTLNGVAVSSVSYGGSALARVQSVVNSSGARPGTEMWCLRLPSPGTSNVVVTLAGTDTFTAGAVGFFGVDQTGPFGAVTNATGTLDSPSLTLGSAPGQIVVDSVAAHAATSGNSGTSQGLWQALTGSGAGDVWGSSSFKPGSTSVTMSWTLSGSGTGEWAAAAVALNPAPNTVYFATLGSGTLVKSAGFSFQLSGPIGSTFVIEASPDLVNWAPIATNAAPNGVVSYTDAAAKNFPFRYYRAGTQ